MSGATRQEILSDIDSVAEEVSGTPKADEYRELADHPINALLEEFGTWNTALEIAGYKLNQQTDFSENDLLDELRRLADGDTPPTYSDIESESKYSVPSYYRTFDSLTDAFKEAGLEPRREPGKRVQLECEICGDNFEVTPSNSSQRFCGMECFGEHRKGMYTGESHPRYTGRIETECHICGDSIILEPWYADQFERNYCSKECFGKGQKELRGPRQTFDYGDGWNEAKREAAREKYGRRCQACGITSEEHQEKYDRKLNVHHIIPAADIENADERNSLKNLVPLCCDCHYIWDEIPLRPRLADP